MNTVMDPQTMLGFSYPGVAIILVLALLAAQYYNGLSHIPGPRSAKFSNFWKIHAAWKGEMPKRNIALHRKYGPLVRMGPNMISVDDPTALSVIYSFKPVWKKKSAFYPIVEALYNGKPLETLFTTRNEQYHTQLLRGAGNAYSMSSLTDLESQVQPIIQLFLDRLEEIGEKGKRAVDAGNWIQYFTFDALGQINFSEEFGFLQSGADVGGNMATIDGLIAYLSVIGQAPWLHNLLLGNPLIQKILPLEHYNEVQKFAIRMIERRTVHGQHPKSGKRDLLDRLLEVSQKDDSKLSFSQIIALTTTNLLAGSATTAVGLRSILYYLCRNHKVLTKLQQEVDEAFASGTLSQPPQYAQAAKLPYLDAVVVEGLRMNPATGFVLERTVPAGGVVLAGKQIPAGTIVGINSWVMHANESVYGADAEVFRPERWLNSEESMRKEMKRCNMTFGAGPRSCVGKNISMMEIVKLLPSLIHRFDIALAHPEQEWKILGHWFTKQSNMDMTFTPRNL